MESQEVQVKLSEIIKSEYPKHYKTKLDFAGASDIDEKTVRRILKGEQNLSLKVFFKICSALELQPSKVLEKIGK